MAGTRTHTYYFSEDDEKVETLKACIGALVEDWDHRTARFVDPEVRHRGHVRLEILKNALVLLTEPAD